MFISYSHKDDDARVRLDTHMAQLKRENVEVFFDGNMLPGAELDPSIRRKLRAADVFVALASPDYLNSRYCYEIEYGFAIRKAGRKALHVVVALLKSCQWRHTRMARYKLLPRDGKPVDQWARRGDAYEDVVEGLRLVVRAVKSERSRQSPSGDPPAPRRAAQAAGKLPGRTRSKNPTAAAPKKPKVSTGKKRVPGAPAKPGPATAKRSPGKGRSGTRK